MAWSPAMAQERVALTTSLGRMVIELDGEKAPVSTENFLQYVDDEFYDGTIFHRVIPNFMIQGGGFTRTMQQKPTRGGIVNEARNGLKNRRGTIAMARTGDPNSATSQFFINVVDNQNLDHPSFDGHGYAVFGRVVEGMDTVDAIRNVSTRPRGGHENVPVDTVVILSARRLATEAVEAEVPEPVEAEEEEAVSVEAPIPPEPAVY
jgi:peptidyl-prolyl cis-trans isomerase A (cyclophilin A)